MRVFGLRETLPVLELYLQTEPKECSIITVTYAFADTLGFYREKKRKSVVEIEAILIRKYGIQTTLDLFDPGLKIFEIRKEIPPRTIFERCQLCNVNEVSETLSEGYLKGKRVCSKCYHDYNVSIVFK